MSPTRSKPARWARSSLESTPAWPGLASATGTRRVPPLRFAVFSTRSQMAGRGRSIPITRAPQLSSTGSGPTSAPAPSTTTVRPGRASQSGDAATVRTASAQDDSMMPAATHASSWRSRASPLSRSPRYGTASSRSAVPPPVASTAVSSCRAGAESKVPRPVSGSPCLITRIRPYSDASPSLATDIAAGLEASPASISARKCPR